MIKAYTIPHSAGMAQSMITALTKAHSQTIRLKGQIGATKALSAFMSIREMRATERDLKTAGIPMQQTAHGTIVPTTGTAKALITQQQLLSQATKQTTDISAGYLETTARTDILTGKVHGLFEEIAGLKQELRDRLEVQPSPFDWGLPSLDDIKIPLIIGAVAIGGLFLAGKYIGKGK